MNGIFMSHKLCNKRDIINIPVVLHYHILYVGMFGDDSENCGKNFGELAIAL